MFLYADKDMCCILFLKKTSHGDWEDIYKLVYRVVHKELNGSYTDFTDEDEFHVEYNSDC